MVVAMIDDLDSKINTLTQLMSVDKEGEASWTPYNQNFDRYFFLDILKGKL